MTPADEQMVTRKEAAAMLGVHPDTIRRFAKAGRLKPHRSGANLVRYKRAEVAACLDDGTPAPAPEIDLVTRDEAAVLLKCSIATIQRRVIEKKLTPVRFGGRAIRFARTEVLALVDVKESA